MTLYHYVGPQRIAARIHARSGTAIRSPGDVLAWGRASGQQLIAGSVVATFVVDEDV